MSESLPIFFVDFGTEIRGMKRNEPNRVGKQFLHRFTGKTHYRKVNQQHLSTNATLVVTHTTLRFGTVGLENFETCIILAD